MKAVMGGLFADRFWLRRGALGSLVIVVPLAAVSLLIASAGGPALGRVLINFLITLSLVVGLQIYTGNSGIFSFGHHVAFMGIAAYVEGLLTISPADKLTLLPNLPTWLQSISLPFGAAAAVTLTVVAILAAFIGWGLARTTPSTASMATFVMLVITNIVLLGATDFTNGASTFFGVPAYTTTPLAFGWATIAIVIARFFRESGPGVRLRASREDQLAAEALGVHVARERFISFVISSIVCGGAGILFAHYLTSFSPKQFYLTITFASLAMLIFGGSASVTGAVVGAGVLSLAAELLTRVENATSVFGLSGVFVGVLILVVLVVRPQGLLGVAEFRPWRQRLRRPGLSPPDIATGSR